MACCCWGFSPAEISIEQLYQRVGDAGRWLLKMEWSNSVERKQWLSCQLIIPWLKFYIATQEHRNEEALACSHAPRLFPCSAWEQKGMLINIWSHPLERLFNLWIKGKKKMALCIYLLGMDTNMSFFEGVIPAKGLLEWQLWKKKQCIYSLLQIHFSPLVRQGYFEGCAVQIISKTNYKVQK